MASVAFLMATVSCSESNVVNNEYERYYGFYTVEVPTISEPNFSEAENKINEEINKFGYDVLERTLISNKSNFSFSPLSAISAISLYINSVPPRVVKCQNEFFNVIDYDDIEDVNTTLIKLIRFLPHESNGCDLEMANSIWMPDVVPDKVKDFAGSYYAEAYSFMGDFDLNDRVDKWVDLKTHGEIKEVPFLTSVSRAVTVNTIYFKGDWLTKFNPNDTGKRPFICDDEKYEVDMMYAELPKASFSDTEKWQSVKLPFNGQFDMILVLPNPGVALPECLEALSQNDYENVQNLFLSLPKFMYKSGCSLRSYFNIPVNVYQHTVIEVNEEGAKAVSATEAVESEPICLTFDRPFLYSIVNRVSGTSIMMGCVFNPNDTDTDN